MFPHAALIILIQVINPVTPLLDRAKQDFSAGRYSEARAELKHALNRAPENAMLWSYLGLTEFKLHNPEAAVADLEKARSLDPQNALNYFNLGMLFHQQGKLAQALEAYRQGLVLAPHDRAASESYARLLMESHHYPEAIQSLAELKKNLPTSSSVRLALIECYIKSGLNDRGVEEIQEFVKRPNCSIHDQLELANLLVENKKADAARWVFEQLVQAKPDLAEAHAGLGFVLKEMDRYQEAAHELGRAVQLSPDSAEYALGYAEVLLLLRQYPAAVHFLDSVKPRFGKLRDYRYELGVAYYGAVQYPAAIDDLSALLRDYPNLDRAQYFLGHCYNASGDVKSAEIHYRRALALNPQDPSYVAAVGHILITADDVRTDEAIGYLEKALQMDPTDLHTKQDLAICYEKRRRYAEAEHLLQDVIRGDPTLLSAHRMLARVYYREKKKDQGDREAAAAAKLDTSQLRGPVQANDYPAPQSH